MTTLHSITHLPPDIDKHPEVPHITVLKKLPSGEIRIETGADGAYLVFDADCLDCLPYCRAQCCAMVGTVIYPDEIAESGLLTDFDPSMGQSVLRRDADGRCHYLDRGSCTCSVYEDRPRTCQAFHCSRGVDVRGWKLPNGAHRHSFS